MAVSLSIQFLWDRYHATAWSSAVNDGTPEWPPSPWRILRALIATKYNKFPEIEDSSFNNLVAKLAQEKPTLFLPESMSSHTRHYMPKANNSKTEKILDAFIVLPRFEGTPTPIVVHWPTSNLSPQETELLDILVNGITYLGRTESQCEVKLIKTDIDALISSKRLKECKPKNESNIVSSDEITTDVLCLNSDLNIDELLQTLKLTVKEVRTVRGRPLPPSTELVPYQMPISRSASTVKSSWAGLPDVSTETNAVIFNIFTSARPSIFSGVVIAEALRKAVMSNYGRLYDGTTSENLSGKDATGQPLSASHLHSHYLALQSPDNQISLLNKLVVWCPAGFNAQEIHAFANIRELGGANFLAARDFRPCGLGFEGYGSIQDISPWIVSPNGATTWKSLTPFCSSRPAEWRKPNWGEIVRGVKKECAYRGLPEPIAVEQLAGNHNWNAYRTHRQSGSNRGLRNARTAYGLKIEFPKLLHGPISLGALSHFGLGLFEPVR